MALTVWVSWAGSRGRHLQIYISGSRKGWGGGLRLLTMPGLQLFKQAISKGQEEVEAQLADSKLKKLEGDNYHLTKVQDIQARTKTIPILSAPPPHPLRCCPGLS